MSQYFPSSGLIRQISHSSASRSGYVCIQCRHGLNPRSFASAPKPIPLMNRRQASNSREKAPFSEKIRQKIWGTKDTPGQADPYGDASVFDQTKKQAEPELVDEIPTTGDKDISKSDAYADYVPATTWDGLDHIGGATGWWEEAWDEEHQFNGFMRPAKLDSNDAVERAIHKAIVEIYMLKQVNEPLSQASQFPTESQFDFSNVKFTRAENGSITIDNGDIGDKSSNLNSITELGKAAGSEAKASTVIQRRDEVPEEALESNLELGDIATTQDITGEGIAIAEGTKTSDVQKLDDKTWMSISLEDQIIKFAVLKRVMQLTGARIADPVIGRIKLVADLVDHLSEKPKPKRLAEQLLAQSALANMPNVQILDRRHTPIDKEKEVGRWKIIERELVKRGLPVTGRD